MMISKKKFKQQLEEYYSSKKQKLYYNTEEVMNLTGISLRTLRYRLNELKVRYEGIPSLLQKKNRKWKIHYTLLDEFIPKYHPRTLTLTNYPWQSFVTWNMVDSYDNEYHMQLIEEVADQVPNNEIIYTIEKTKAGINHVHFITDVDAHTINNKTIAVLNQYLDSNKYRLEAEPLRKKSQAIRYLNKD